jgi:hypothetical protein
MMLSSYSKKLKRQGPSFLQGVLFAAVLGFFASVMLVTLGPFFGHGLSLRLLIPALSLVYLLFLFSQSQERVGRVTTLLVWLGIAALAWWLELRLPLYLLIHVTLIWLVRSLYFHSNITSALLDFGLSALSAATAFWALSRTGSVFLACWSFFLVQALFISIPKRIGHRTGELSNAAAGGHKFDGYRKEAEKALEQLFTQ